MEWNLINNACAVLHESQTDSLLEAGEHERNEPIDIRTNEVKI